MNKLELKRTAHLARTVMRLMVRERHTAHIMARDLARELKASPMIEGAIIVRIEGYRDLLDRFDKRLPTSGELTDLFAVAYSELYLPADEYRRVFDLVFDRSHHEVFSSQG